MVTPLPHQTKGALWLAARPRAYLADQPRVGKTGTAIIAADYALAERLLVVTTSSGRPVWRRAFNEWSTFGRKVDVPQAAADPKADVSIVSWANIANPTMRASLMRGGYDAIILDEAHFAKNFSAKRTQAAYGEIDGDVLDDMASVVRQNRFVWCLSGTPMPNSPFDLYPPLRALQPHRLAAHDGMPDVTREQDFMHRYCIVKMKKLNAWRKIPVVIGGRNLEELKHRIDGFMLRRTQQDVGIRAPIFDILPLAVSAGMKKQFEADVLASRLLDAAEAGDTKALEMHLGPLRRLTGVAKALSIVEAVKDEFDCGLDKIVIAYWHKEVGDVLEGGLSSYGVVRLDGSTSPTNREEAEQRFLRDPETRVFLGQIQAAGEAIDLSSAAELLFAEVSFQPAQMKQMSLRVTNHGQARQVRVRVAALEGSIDEALQQILMRKWSAINEVLE